MMQGICPCEQSKDGGEPMSAPAGIGYSLAKNPKKAGEQAASQAIGRISGQKCHSCLVFCTVGYDIAILLDAVKEVLGDVRMLGCSGEGIIAPGLADESNHSVLVIVFSDPRMRMHTAETKTPCTSKKPANHLGAQLAKHQRKDTRCALVFACGLNTIADELIQGIERNIGSSIPILGGLSGDNHRRDKTYQFCNWKIIQGGASAALLSGSFDVLTDVSHGCTPLGTAMEITRAEGNRLFELDGRPLMDLLVEFLGEGLKTDFGKVSIHFCIGQTLRPELANAYDPFIIRYIAKYNADEKSISLPINLKTGEKIWLTRRDRDKMFAAANRTVQKHKTTLKGMDPFFAFHFDCAGRGKIVLSEEDKLLLTGRLHEGISTAVPWGGLFTYGEFCPINGQNVLHNYSAVVALLAWST
jgi:hypothetical protein